MLHVQIRVGMTLALKLRNCSHTVGYNAVKYAESN
jgi:hypothetical protein